MEIANLCAVGFLLLFCVFNCLDFPVPKVTNALLTYDLHLLDFLYFLLLDGNLILGVLADPPLILIFGHFSEMEPLIFGLSPIGLLCMYFIHNFLAIGSEF